VAPLVGAWKFAERNLCINERDSGQLAGSPLAHRAAYPYR